LVANYKKNIRTRGGVERERERKRERERERERERGGERESRRNGLAQ
jgi:hypothetical protein